MQLNIGNVPLLGEVPEENAQNFSVVPQSDVQDVKAIGAADITQFLRGNKKLTWTFSVSRVHDNAEQAAFFALDHEAKFPLQGTFTFVTDAGEKSYSNAVAVITALTFDGASSKHTYRLTSGGSKSGTIGLDAGNPTGGISLVTF